MPTQPKGNSGPCNPACTKVIKFMTDQEIGPNVGISIPPYQPVDGYRYINIFVEYTQERGEEPPLNLGVVFAFDARGGMGARRYVNLEANVSAQQKTNFIDVSGQDTWHGVQWKKASYVARLPVMGPYVQVFPDNQAPVKRTVSIWGYAVS